MSTIPSTRPRAYFVVGAGRLTVSQAIAGPFDLIVTAGRERLQYRAVEGSRATGRTDRTRTVGGGVGYRLGRSLRLTLIYDVTSGPRASSRPRLPAQRLFGSATYGV